MALGVSSVSRVLCAVAAVFVLAALLAVSPLAASVDGELVDVSDGVHSADVRALYSQGVFDGTLCGQGRFCPQEPLTRAHMAVWLVRVLHGGDPPPLSLGGSGPRFGDVGSDHRYGSFIERLAVAGVTTGCSVEPLLFCPDDNVTREQMASFLVRAFKLHPAEPAGFVDVSPGGVHSADIDALHAAGVTTGCSVDPLLFCGAVDVTREQMASFLARAVRFAPPVVSTSTSASSTTLAVGAPPPTTSQPPTTTIPPPPPPTLTVVPPEEDEVLLQSKARTPRVGRHATKFYMVCDQRKVIEADSFTATVVRTHNDHASKFFAYWHTDDGTANTDDYNDVNNVYQLSSSGALRMNRTLSTKHDARIESTENFAVRFSPTTNVLDSNDPDKDEKCFIKIIDDDAEITLSEPRWGKWYTAGETIEFTARFGEAVTWNVDNKTLEFSLGVGDDAQTKTATYISGKGTNQIKFGYTVEADDLDPNGLYVARNSFRGGDLRNVAQDIYFPPRNAEKSYPDNRVDGSLADVSTGIQTSYDPWGIAVDGDTLYISAAKTESSNYLIGIWANDFTDDTGGVYARDTDKDFNGRTRSDWWAVRGIFVSDDRLYVAEPHNERVPGYSLDGSWSHSWRNRVKTHADEWIQGIWPDTSDSANERLYVVSHNGDKIRAYSYPGDGNTINHDSDRDIDLHSDNAWPRGVWSNGATIWVADSADDKLYAYAFIDNLLGPGSSRGDRLPDSDIDLHRGNDNPKGIWSDGRRFYVVDSETKRVFKYPYNAAHPDKPANVIATATSSSEITLTWDPPADVGSSAIVSYRSRYRAAGETNWQEGFRNRLANLDRSFDFTGLTADTAYDFQVFATNDHGESHASITVQGRTHEAVNQAPVCQQNTPPLTGTAHVDQAFLWRVSPNWCSDPESEFLAHSATLTDNTALPAWLTYRDDGYFRGTPANDDAADGDLAVKITVTDPHGLSDSHNVIIQMRGYQAPSDDAPTVVSAIADQSFYIGDSVNLKITGTITDTEDGEALAFNVDKPVPEASWLRPGLQSGSLHYLGTVPETMTRGTVISITVYGIDNALQSADYTFSITSLGSRSTNPTPANPGEVPPIITEPVVFRDYVIMRQGPGYICGDPAAEYIVVLAVKVDPPADGTTLAPDPDGFNTNLAALLEVAKTNLAPDQTFADIDFDALEQQALEATYAKHQKFNDKVAEFAAEHHWPTTINQKVVWAYYYNGHNEYHHYAHEHGRTFEF